MDHIIVRNIISPSKKKFKNINKVYLNKTREKILRRAMIFPIVLFGLELFAWKWIRE